MPNGNERVLAIVGSARDDSNTAKTLIKKIDYLHMNCVELHRLQINAYQYDPTKRIPDDFDSVVEKMLDADRIVFATPVYWYAMSGILKVFFDRLTELVTTSKDQGRKLKGKKTELFAVGADSELPEGFEVPFQRTSEYFGMVYEGVTYVQKK